MPIMVRCPAKLNLFLEVLGKRADGYHDLDTVMQAVDLCDELRIAPAEGEELSLECSEPSLPTDGRNLVVRAALALRERVGRVSREDPTAGVRKEALLCLERL